MNKYLAEVVGTFILVFIGSASVVFGGLGGALPIGQIGIGLSFGLAVTAAAYSIGPVSGAHLNPAVTLGVFLAGRMKVADVIPYFIAQVIGAAIASGVILFIAKGKLAGYDVATAGLAQNGWDPAIWSTTAVLAVEVVATFVFVTVILGVTHPKHATPLAGLVIGLTLAILHFAFIPVSGNSLNPARALGPALYVGGLAISQVWLYVVAPLVGGALAGILSKTGLLNAE